MSRPLTLRQKLIGSAAFTSIYCVSTVALERRYKRKSPFDHTIAGTVAGFAVALGGGNPFAGLAIGLGLSAVSAPLYWWAYSVQGLPTLSEMLEQTEMKKEEKEDRAKKQKEGPTAVASSWPAPATPAEAPKANEMK